MHGGLAVPCEGDRVDGASLESERPDALFELLRDERARGHVGLGAVLLIEPALAVKTVEGTELSVRGEQIDAEREAETARVHGPENGGSEKNGRHRKKSPGERQRVGEKSCATPTERTF